jgi:hypothetical protein
MITKFIITTTGTVSPVKLEGLGSYHEHPTTLDLMERFPLNEIVEDFFTQQAIDNGEITVVDQNGNEIINLKYLLNGTPIVDIDNVDNLTSYIGYGELNACKIQKITTTTNGYNISWSEGNQNFDKEWGLRLSYSYF